MRPLLLALALVGCGAVDDIGQVTPAVSLTCEWAPDFWVDVDGPECFRVEAKDSSTRVGVVGVNESCPTEWNTCATAQPGQRLIIYGKQLSAESLLFWEGPVDCRSTCGDVWE
jgi:hypothetical protein